MAASSIPGFDGPDQRASVDIERRCGRDAHGMGQGDVVLNCFRCFSVCHTGVEAIKVQAGARGIIRYLLRRGPSRIIEDEVVEGPEAALAVSTLGRAGEFAGARMRMFALAYSLHSASTG